MPPALAIFLTWTTYGTWLQGDPRGSHQRRSHSSPRSIASSPALRASNDRALKHPPTRLNEAARIVVHDAIKATCEHRGWVVHALNVRSNHVHAIVSGNADASSMLRDLKSWATRRLREGGIAGAEQRVWTRHASTRYIDTHASLARAIDYVDRFQDEPRE